MGCADLKDANGFWRVISIARIITPGLPQYLENLKYLEILEKQAFSRFQQDVPGKPGKKLYIDNSLEICFIYSCLYIFMQAII